MKHVLIWALMTGAMAEPAMAGPVEDVVAGADVVIVGEVHDNPAHHVVQTEVVAHVQPAALVFEMLTRDQAGRVAGVMAGDPAEAANALGWADSGWPDFDMYRPIFEASDARVYGAAVSRDVARRVFADGVVAHFDGDAAAFALTDPLEATQQAARLDLQFDAHCEAMPREALGGMVEVQRLRDATLAQAVAQAMQDTGGPVVVITGNGHARRDWGVPFYVARVVPDATVISIGQGEEGGTPDGGFDLVLDAPGVERPDPCDAFR